MIATISTQTQVQSTSQKLKNEWAFSVVHSIRRILVNLF